MLVPAGSYKLEFSDLSDEWNSEWWEDAASASLATEIDATDGAELTFDAVLVSAGAQSSTPSPTPALAPAGQGTISGRVTAPGGAGIAALTVNASPVGGGTVGSATTDSSGNYTMDVPVGSYKITFSPATNSQWVWEYYNDVRDYSAATILTVAEGATVANINAQLAQWSQITGKVTAPGGVGIAGVTVSANPIVSGLSFIATTDSSGNYTLRVHAGTYRIQFTPAASSPWVWEYYNDTQILSAATPVTVAAGATAASINAQLAQMGTISGRVTAPGGAGIAGVAV